MSSRKIAITLDAEILSAVDALVNRRIFPSRSRAIQIAVKEKLDRLSDSQLARECSKLDPEQEQALAEEGLREDLSEWPEC